MPDYSNLTPGTELVVADSPARQIVVKRSAAGWTEEVVWKPGFEPAPELSEADRLRVRVAELEALLITAGVLTKTDVAAAASAETTAAAILPPGEVKP